MLSTEVLEARYAKGKAYYKVVRDFVDSPPQGFNVVFDPSTMEEDRPVESRSRLFMAIGVGFTPGDNWEIDPLGMDYYNGKKWTPELGVLLRVRADQGLVATSGIDARFFYPQDPTELLEPMKSLSLSPSGWIDQISYDGGRRYNITGGEEKKAVAIVGIVANAITENRLLVPDIYWIQKITGNTFPPGVSPFPARR